MTLYTKIGIYAGICVLLLGGYKAWEWKVRAAERVAIAIEEGVRREDFWRPIAVARKSKLKVLVQNVQKQDTLLKFLRDTLIEHKTDTVLVARFIEQADSTVKACRVLTLTCGETVAAQDSLIAALEKQREGLRRQLPGLGSKTKTALLWAVVGFVAGNLVTQSVRK